MESKFSFKVKPYKIFMNNVDLGFCGRLNILLYNAFTVSQEEEACKEKKLYAGKTPSFVCRVESNVFFFVSRNTKLHETGHYFAEFLSFRETEKIRK